MSNTASWLIGVVLALALVGMIAYARGPKHHRGDEVGTHGTKIIVVQPSP
jgi:hypothetical protein